MKNIPIRFSSFHCPSAGRDVLIQISGRGHKQKFCVSFSFLKSSVGVGKGVLEQSPGGNAFCTLSVRCEGSRLSKIFYNVEELMKRTCL